jgi:hypothetical protein
VSSYCSRVGLCSCCDMCGRFHDPEHKDRYPQEPWASVAQWLGTETVVQRQACRDALQLGRCRLVNKQSAHNKRQTLGHDHNCCGRPFSLHLHMHVIGDCVVRTRELFLEEFHERGRKDNIKADF